MMRGSGDLVRRSDIISERGLIMILDSRTEAVESYIPACFNGSTLPVRAGDPDNVSFGVCSVAKEACGLFPWIKFTIRGWYDARRTMNTEGAEVRKIWFVMIPELERGCVRRNVRMRDAIFDMNCSLNGKGPKPTR
jgi:hypothetical protein